MNCNCNNKNEKLPDVRIVQGNVLRLAIPLTLRTLEKVGDEIQSTDTDFIPSSDYPVTAVFSRGKKRYDITATMDGNIAVVEDNGTIEVGTYDITIECRDDNGNPYRFKQEATLQVVDTTAEAGIDSDIEFEVEPWYLNAAIYLATVEIGEMTEVIDQKLADVFGDVEYDSATKVIRFFNKEKTGVLGELDARPFVADSSIEDVYIDTGRQVLVIRLNADANNRVFTVPLYLLFANYNTKAEVTNMIDGVYYELDRMVGNKANLTSGKVPYGESSAVVLDAINVSVPTNIPAWMIGKVHYCVDGKIRRYVNSGTNYAVAIVSTPDPYLIYFNRADGKFYTWNSTSGMEEIETGSGSGGGGGTGEETDPIFSASPAAGITQAIIDYWNAKQEAIGDLGQIRAGAAAGATALQPGALDGYATSDAVNRAIARIQSAIDELMGADDVTEAIDTFREIVAFLDSVENTETLAGIIAGLNTSIAAKYTKPSTGIPASDLAGAVQTSLEKADTALQQKDIHVSYDAKTKTLTLNFGGGSSSK